MQLTDALCYALLTITMAAACAHAERTIDDKEDRNLDRIITRRTATVLIDTAPVERMFQKPKVLYRRVSVQKKRQAPTRATYGPPRPKYGPPRKPLRKPGKKYKGKINHKHVTPAHKKRSPKPRYRSTKPTMKPVYGPPKISPHKQYYHSSAGFGEPPASLSTRPRPTKPRPNFNDFGPKPNFGNEFASKPDFEDDFSSKPNDDFSSPPTFGDDLSNAHFGNDFRKPEFSDFPKQSYGEPPVDSYGAPIKPNLRDLTFSTAQSSPDSTSNVVDYTFGNVFGNNHRPWKNYRNKNPDSNFANSNKVSAFSQPDPNIFITPIPENHKDEMHMNSYSEIYNFRQTNKNKKKKASYHENVKIINRPWKGNKGIEESDDEMIVGGQYAEPPARYVPKFQPSAPMKDNDDSVFSPPYGIPDSDSLSSAAISSYVNYKNSNMAFSPQNLNDAFSIVDK